MAMEQQQMIVTAVAVGAFAATLFWMKQWTGQNNKDILQSILDKSAPVAASEELASSGREATCERRLNGQQLIITKDPVVAYYVFFGDFRKNFVRRPASEEGLRKLGMYGRGLIWNNHLPVWQRVRECFQKALNAAALKEAESVVRQEAIELLDECHSQTNAICNEGIPSNADVKPRAHQVPINMLTITRRLTFRATLSVFFGLSPSTFQANGIDEGGFIYAIVAYFKAWEYFLFRPQRTWDSRRLQEHSRAVAVLQDHVRHMLTTTAANGRSSKAILFVDMIRQSCTDAEESTELFEQAALEMLLAGTDTSSVTAYYALLGLAGDAELQRALREDLNDNSKKKVLLDCVINETLRFKPVGPVVLREAVVADPKFPGRELQKGAAVLVHLAEMNLYDKYWEDPTVFRPQRFLDAATNGNHKTFFFPFGEGPKGCIGMHLGRREVGVILETIVCRYDLSIEGASTLGSLETHWDIANQPDKPAMILIQDSSYKASKAQVSSPASSRSLLQEHE